MNGGRSLLLTLDRLFAGPREAPLSVAAFLEGLDTRSYPFIVAALVLPNCVPTGIPLLSTITGIPMILVAVQAFMGRHSPWLPDSIGRRAIARGRLQDFLARIHPQLERIEAAIHPRRSWWVTGTRRRLLHVACAVIIVILALPIPLDNLFAAWSVLFFCLALLEDDGVMAMLGWLLAAITIAWTAFLLIVGPWVVINLLKSIF